MYRVSNDFKASLQFELCISYLVYISYPIYNLQSIVCILYWPVTKCRSWQFLGLGWKPANRQSNMAETKSINGDVGGDLNLRATQQ